MNKINGLTLPEDVNMKIRQKAHDENRSMANVIARIVIEYFSKKQETEENEK